MNETEWSARSLDGYYGWNGSPPSPSTAVIIRE